MSALDKLDRKLQQQLVNRVLARKMRFLKLRAGEWKPSNGQLLLIGDRPAPSAPRDLGFHYTPFGALTNSSLWLNQQLEQFHIPEDGLAWVNATDINGVKTDHKILEHHWGGIIALGNNAKLWACKGTSKVVWLAQHPSAWKRFHSREPYPLLGLLSLGTE